MPNPKGARRRVALTDVADAGDAYADRLERLGAAPDVVEAGRADPAAVGLSDVALRDELRSIESEPGLAVVDPDYEVEIRGHLRDNVDDVIAWVGDDVELARAVAQVERTGAARVTLLRHLDAMVPGPS